MSVLENAILDMLEARKKAVKVLKEQLTEDNYEELIEKYFPKIYGRSVQVNEQNEQENEVGFSICHDDCIGIDEVEDVDIEAKMLDLINVIYPELEFTGDDASTISNHYHYTILKK